MGPRADDWSNMSALKNVETEDDPNCSGDIKNTNNCVHDRCHPLIRKDSAYAWLVVFGSCVAYFLYGGGSAIVGMIQVEYQQLIPNDNNSIYIIGAFISGAPFMLAPFIAAACKVLSCRSLCLTGGFLCSIGFLSSFFSTSLPVVILGVGVLPAIGFGLLVTPSTIMVGQSFDKRRSLAVSIGLWGAGLGIVILPILLSQLIQSFGFRGALLVCSGIFLHGMLAGTIYISPPKRKQSKGTMNICKEVWITIYDKELMKMKHFFPSMTSYFFMFLSYTIPLIFLPVKSNRIGLSLDLSSSLLSAMGICSVVGRIVAGLITATSAKRRLLYIFLACIVNTVALLGLALTKTYAYLVIISSLVGLTTGGFVSLGPCLLLDLFGADKLPSSLGLYYLGGGVGSLIGGPLGSLVSEKNDNNAFLIGAACSAIGTVLLISVIVSLCHSSCRFPKCRSSDKETTPQPQNVYTITST